MAVVESIYSSLILDTKQYEEALRKIVGISKDAEKTFDDGFKKGKQSVDDTTKSVGNMGNALKALGAAASFGAIVTGFKGMIDSAVQAESQIKGLAAVVKNRLGEDAIPKATSMVSRLSAELGLTKEAVTGAMKNLTAMNFTLEQQEKLLRGATDIAVDNRQSNYDLSESVKVWTEGLKNGNSVLSDAIGVSENIGAQYKRLGVESDNLTKKLEGQADRQKLVNDFTEQFSVFSGRAEENLQGYAGATASLGKSTGELSIALGNALREGVTPLLSVLASGTAKLASFAQNMGPVTRGIVVFTGSIAALAAGAYALNSTLLIVAPQVAASLTLMTGGLAALGIGIAATIALFSQLGSSTNQAMASIQTEAQRLSQQNGIVASETKTMLVNLTEGLKRAREEGDAQTRIAASQVLIESIRNASGLIPEYKNLLMQLAGSARDSTQSFNSLSDAINRMQTTQRNGTTSGTGGGGARSASINPMQPMIDAFAANDAKLQLNPFANWQESADKFSAKMTQVGSIVSNFGSVIVQNLQAAAQLAAVKFNNLKQNVDFFASALNAISQKEADQRQADFDEQIASIDAQNQRLLDQQRQYELDRAALKAEFDTNAKAENDRQFEIALAAMREDFETKKAYNDANSADQNQRLINDEQMQADFNNSRLKLRSDFDQKLLDQTKINDKKQEDAAQIQAIKKAAAEKALVEQKAAAEKAKKDADEKAQKEEKDRTKAFELFKWASGRAAFELDKKAKVAQAVMATAMMVLDITRAAFGPGFPFTLPFLGFIPMALQTGQMTVQATQSAQYPPPPLFANGGMATGPSIFGEAGPELAIPMNNPGKDFGALKEEIAVNLTKGAGGNITNVYMEGIQINGSNMDRNELADFVASKIRSEVYMAVGA